MRRAQRAIDAAARDMGPLDDMVEGVGALCRDVLQPLVDEAHNANNELPLLQEELLNASLMRAETLAKLREVQDAAADERQKHLHEMSMISKAFTEHKEQSTFQAELAQSQLASYSQQI